MAPYEELVAPSRVRAAVTQFCVGPRSGVDRTGRRPTVTVTGDGAVGLSAVLAARRLGAERIILMGRHKTRTELGREFGATDVVAERGLITP
jgi:threonine dehydrogenase-like Zn-dependent dehydrogenase